MEDAGCDSLRQNPGLVSQFFFFFFTRTVPQLTLAGWVRTQQACVGVVVSTVARQNKEAKMATVVIVGRLLLEGCCWKVENSLARTRKNWIVFLSCFVVWEPCPCPMADQAMTQQGMQLSEQANVCPCICVYALYAHGCYDSMMTTDNLDQSSLTKLPPSISPHLSPKLKAYHPFTDPSQPSGHTHSQVHLHLGHGLRHRLCMSSPLRLF